jgi:membrane fusion protein (multidrug efflux system)
MDAISRTNADVRASDAPISLRVDRQDATEEPSVERHAASKTPTTRRPVCKILIASAVVLVLAAGGYKAYGVWADGRHYESTDDAFVDGHVSQVAAQVSGRVTAITVEDNQMVVAGQPLLVIDPRDFDVRLKEMRAQRASTAAQIDQIKAQLELQQATIEQSAANVRVADSDALQAKQDFGRYSAILPQATTRQEIDRASASARSTAAKVDAARQGLAAAKAQLAVLRAQLAGSQASLQQADAQVENATLQLSYTHLDAPVAGRVTKRTVEVGNYVNPGQALMSVVSDRVWVTANFKETQLADMAPGQKVDLYIDAYPRHAFAGRVDSFQTGTGSAFSSLPAENATGNYVKVVQRLPVKIVFDDADLSRYRLAPGMSVQPKVRVR